MSEDAGGLRLSIARGAETEVDGAWIYRGTIVVHGVSYDVGARVTASEATLTWASAAPPDVSAIEKSARALIRAATRAELAEGRPPPRRVTRWREA